MVYVEGEVTEKEYLECLRTRLGIPKELVGIKSTSFTDTSSIVKYAIRQKKKFESNRSVARVDQWWVLVDTEGEGIPQDTVDMAKSNGIYLAVNGPSFEFWLLLHFCYSTRHFINARAACAELEKYVPGYRGNNKSPDMEVFGPLICDAVKNACQLRAKGLESEGVCCCTDTDILVCSMNRQAKDDHELFKRDDPQYGELFVQRRR